MYGLSLILPPEKTVLIPLWAVVAIGDSFDDAQVGAIEIGGGLKIYGLLQIIGRRVIAFSAPALDDFVFRRTLSKSYFQ